MNCSICQKPIEAHTDNNGEVYWAHGHNAQPVNDGRCCDTCNDLIVIPARIQQMLNHEDQKEVQDAE